MDNTIDYSVSLSSSLPHLALDNPFWICLNTKNQLIPSKVDQYLESHSDSLSNHDRFILMQWCLSGSPAVIIKPSQRALWCDQLLKNIDDRIAENWLSDVLAIHPQKEDLLEAFMRTEHLHSIGKRWIAKSIRTAHATPWSQDMILRVEPSPGWLHHMSTIFPDTYIDWFDNFSKHPANAERILHLASERPFFTKLNSTLCANWISKYIEHHPIDQVSSMPELLSLCQIADTDGIFAPLVRKEIFQHSLRTYLSKHPDVSVPSGVVQRWFEFAPTSSMRNHVMSKLQVHDNTQISMANTLFQKKKRIAQFLLGQSGSSEKDVRTRDILIDRIFSWKEQFPNQFSFMLDHMSTNATYRDTLAKSILICLRKYPDTTFKLLNIQTVNFSVANYFYDISEVCTSLNNNIQLQLLSDLQGWRKLGDPYDTLVHHIANTYLDNGDMKPPITELIWRVLQIHNPDLTWKNMLDIYAHTTQMKDLYPEYDLAKALFEYFHPENTEPLFESGTVA